VQLCEGRPWRLLGRCATALRPTCTRGRRRGRPQLY